MLRASIASFACLALCVPFALAQRTETETKSTKEGSRPSGTSSRPPSTSSRPPSTSSHSPSEAAAKKLPERSMTMQQEAAARLAKQRREEAEARRQALHLQHQENLRRQRLYPDPIIEVPQQQAPAPQVSPGMGGAGPVTAPAITPVPSGGIVVSCSAAPSCPSASGGNVCKSVELTYGGANAASVGRRDIVTVCQQANSPEACCVQQCANAGRCTAQNASFR